eukprot:sb/3466935/
MCVCQRSIRVFLCLSAFVLELVYMFVTVCVAGLSVFDTQPRRQRVLVSLRRSDTVKINTVSDDKLKQKNSFFLLFSQPLRVLSVTEGYVGALCETTKLPMPLVCPQCLLGPALVILVTSGIWYPGVTNKVTTQLRQTKFGLASGKTAHPRHRLASGGNLNRAVLTSHLSLGCAEPRSIDNIIPIDMCCLVKTAPCQVWYSQILKSRMKRVVERYESRSAATNTCSRRFQYSQSLIFICFRRSCVYLLSGSIYSTSSASGLSFAELLRTLIFVRHCPHRTLYVCVPEIYSRFSVLKCVCIRAGIHVCNSLCSGFISF